LHLDGILFPQINLIRPGIRKVRWSAPVPTLCRECWAIEQI